jgi:hypothetical protein
MAARLRPLAVLALAAGLVVPSLTAAPRAARAYPHRLASCASLTKA